MNPFYPLNPLPWHPSSIDTFDPSKQLLDAVNRGEEEVVNQLIDNNQFSAETLIQALISAYHQHQFAIVKLILNRKDFTADMRNQLFSVTINQWDSKGDNLALELAKKLDDSYLKDEAIQKVEEKLTQKSNEEFRKNLAIQLHTIRHHIQWATKSAEETPHINQVKTESANHWLIEQLPVHRATVDAQCQVLTEMTFTKDPLTIVYAGSANACVKDICSNLANTKRLNQLQINQASAHSVDVILAPHTYSEMEVIFKASESLLDRNNPLPVEQHPLFNYFNLLNKEGVFIVTLNSGPNVQDLTHIMLGTHELELSKANQSSTPKLKIFNNVETFFRCFDIFHRKYEEKTGKTIHCDLSFSMPHVPLEDFCKGYIKQFPELAKMNTQELEKFVRLLSVFNIGNDIVDLNITIKMTQKEKDNQTKRSFKPIAVNFQEKENEKNTSNEISLSQQNLDKQIQNLDGSELVMTHIKKKDGPLQFNALSRVLHRQVINMAELGGGEGKTNTVPKAIQEAGPIIHLFNVEPHPPFATPYIKAHHAVGIDDVHVLQRTAQLLSVNDVIEHFHDQKVDVLFASHFFYFLLGDLHKASQEFIQDSTKPLAQHPLFKYFNMLREDGVFVITIQTGAGARLFRNALLGNHGLNPPSSETPDETKLLLSSFGNLATLLRHFELFAEHFQKETGKVIHIKMDYAVANVPLGDFKIEQDQETGGYMVRNPNGESNDPNWLSPRMLNYYGNWNELQKLATMTPEKEPNMPLEELRKQRESAKKTQEIFHHILPVFALANQKMQHPNATLTVTMSNPLKK